VNSPALACRSLEPLASRPASSLSQFKGIEDGRLGGAPVSNQHAPAIAFAKREKPRGTWETAHRIEALKGYPSVRRQCQLAVVKSPRWLPRHKGAIGLDNHRHRRQSRLLCTDPSQMPASDGNSAWITGRSGGNGVVAQPVTSVASMTAPVKSRGKGHTLDLRFLVDAEDKRLIWGIEWGSSVRRRHVPNARCHA